MKPPQQHRLQLLAPAANAAIAFEAIRHGADAIYIGPPSHGARKSASNSIEDISAVVDYAHRFGASVYATVNTIVYDDELRQVEALCRKLYRVGVDALIVQDMGLLRLDLPPIALHASTQCDIRTPEKARFLQDVGFSQLVLARELTLREIKAITEAVDIPVECFIHGALCVSYSGRCHASCVTTGRSANRGECAQICRLPYNLVDSNGREIARNRHLLSLKDFNASESLPDLVNAGVSSFKIEGRLKDAGYVKNIVAHYNSLLNNLVRESGGEYVRSSFGKVDISFTPSPAKSFNRGFTEYFLKNRRPDHIASLFTPKSMGEPVTDIRMLHNGDGIGFVDSKGEWQGVNINKVEAGKLITARNVDIPKGSTLFRTLDIEWQKLIAKPTATRKIRMDVKISATCVEATDERGCRLAIPLDATVEKATKPMTYQNEFAKLGTTDYYLGEYHSDLDPYTFIPRSEISGIRRRLVELLDKCFEANYVYEYRRGENPDAIYPLKRLDFRENVANAAARAFYESHGATVNEMAMETTSSPGKESKVVMTTRHCILRELGMCRRLVRDRVALPLFLESGSRRFRLHFNCADCEMEVLTEPGVKTHQS